MQDVKIGIPYRFLTLVIKALDYQYGIPAAMSIHGKAPCVVLSIGNLTFFNSSGDMRIFLDPPVDSATHKTFSDPELLLEFIAEQYEEIV